MENRNMKDFNMKELQALALKILLGSATAIDELSLSDSEKEALLGRLTFYVSKALVEICETTIKASEQTLGKQILSTYRAIAKLKPDPNEDPYQNQ